MRRDSPPGNASENENRGVEAHLVHTLLLLLFLLPVLLLLLLLLLVSQGPDRIADPVLELLPRVPVQSVAQLSEVVHLAPAVPAPLAAGHVDKKVPVLFLVVDPGVIAGIATGTLGEAVDPALRDECHVRPDPRLVHVHVFERILLLVLPLHVLLLVANRIPPDVKQAVGPYTASDEERPEVEATAVLGDDQIDGLRLAVSHRGPRDRVKILIGQGVRDIERIVFAYVAVGVLFEVFEDVVLERVGWLHDESV